MNQTPTPPILPSLFGGQQIQPSALTQLMQLLQSDPKTQQQQQGAPQEQGSVGGLTPTQGYDPNGMGASALSQLASSVFGNNAVYNGFGDNAGINAGATAQNLGNQGISALMSLFA